MTRAASLHRTTVGLKILMAATGFLLFGFVFVHMLGNLKVFYGAGHDGHAAKLDQYAHFLRTFGEPALGEEQLLWIARIVLLAAVAIHLWAAIALTLRNRAARPVGYRKWKAETSTYASRTMIWGGVIIGLFVVYHILHFTTGHLYPGGLATVVIDGETSPGAFANVVGAFSIWWVALIYIVANVALGFHLYHGVWSSLKSLGADNPRYEGARRAFSAAFAVAVTAGNVSVPVAVLSGLVG